MFFNVFTVFFTQFPRWSVTVHVRTVTCPIDTLNLNPTSILTSHKPHSSLHSSPRFSHRTPFNLHLYSHTKHPSIFTSILILTSLYSLPPYWYLPLFTGRVGNSSETALDTCSWRFNRFLAHGAHTEGFTVFEREELEHRILSKSEFFKSEGTVVPSQILEKPAPQIVGSALLTLISCLKKGELPSFIERKSSSLQKKKSKDLI